MTKRKAISSRVRFEVFKRDKFTCQFCGAKAPEVILHVDHIHPVAEGGTNDILNLLTACQACNGGKGKRLLSDQSAIEKQHAQLAELEERRQQIELMLKWRQSTVDNEKHQIDSMQKIIAEKTGYGFNEHGRSMIRQMLKNHNLFEILAAADDAFDRYAQYDKNGKMTSQSWNEAFNRIANIAKNEKLKAEKPWLAKIFYIRGILRKRLDRINEWKVIEILKDFHAQGGDLEWAQQHAKIVEKYWHFERDIEDATKSLSEGKR